METKTIIKSTEIIKPSSPTPKSLQKHQLSFLDQLTPSFFIHLIYYYNSSDPKILNSQKSNHLKNTLSKTLSTYYPLAGRLVSNLYVDCNDAGVPFYEAEANYNLSTAISDPNPKNNTKFLPYKGIDRFHNLCLAVQATYFRCGGVAIGILITHKIADAFSLVSFINSWSTVARNGHLGGVPMPKFDVAAYFSPQNFLGFDSNMKHIEEEVVTKTLIFAANTISLLQERYSGGGGRRPSRVEALSAFIWTRLISSMKSDPSKIHNVMMAANLRTRINDLPPSEYHFGNVVGVSNTVVTAGEGGVELTQKLRQANDVVYDSYKAQLKESSEKRENWLSETISQTNKSVLPINTCFTSLCGFPLYEVDFGWGKPVRVSFIGFPDKNLVVFIDEKTGGGIEALIHLSKEDMKKFENDLELQPLVLKSNL